MLSDRAVGLGLAAVLLFAAILYVVSYSMWANPGQVIQMLESIGEAAEQGRWEEARTEVSRLNRVWTDRLSIWLSVNYAELDFNNFGNEVSRLKGAIETEDHQTVQESVEMLKGMWRNFNKVIPKP